MVNDRAPGCSMLPEATGEVLLAAEVDEMTDPARVRRHAQRLKE